MSLKHAERTLRAALDGVTAELESMLRAEVLRQSKRRKRTVTAYSAMGTWAMYAEGADGEKKWIDNAPVFRAFERVRALYGWGAIPAPVMFISGDGETALRQDSW